MKQTKFWILLVLFTSVLMTACNEEEKKSQISEADKLIEATQKNKNYSELLKVVDSLEANSIITPTKACYWRGYACDKMKRQRLAEYYWKASLEAAKEYPNTKFVGMTNCGSQVDGNPNTYNAFAAIYEARYVAGIAAGMKLQQEINEGKIKASEAVMGYVGAFSFAEVISGMSGFYLGAKSVCPSVTMKVYFVGTWGDATLEEAAANALIDAGCKLISQHSDTTSPALAAQKAGIFHVGYNTDMTKVAPNASLLSSRIDWTRYFYTFIKNHIDGKENKSDWTGTYAEGDVKVTDLNTAIAAPGTQEAMDKAIKAFHDGTLKVFDLSTFTIEGKKGTNETMYDSFAAVQGNATYDGFFHESELQSAPYFVGKIDGIEWLNAAY